jgi:hypothetical protein
VKKNREREREKRGTMLVEHLDGTNVAALSQTEAASSGTQRRSASGGATSRQGVLGCAQEHGQPWQWHWKNKATGKGRHKLRRFEEELRTMSCRTRRHHRTKQQGKLASLPHWEEEAAQEQKQHRERTHRKKAMGIGNDVNDGRNFFLSLSLSPAVLIHP